MEEKAQTRFELFLKNSCVICEKERETFPNVKNYFLKKGNRNQN